MNQLNLDTIGDFVRWTASELARHEAYLGHGSDSYWDEAIYLVTGALKLSWDLDPWVMGCKVTPAEQESIIEMISQRTQGRIPLPYLLGEAWFCGVNFKVNQHTLIPRSPIAELIQAEYEPWLVNTPDRVLDLCTGSGCIGIATALAFPYALVDLSDISADALEVAKQNIERYELAQRVSCIESDLFKAIPKDREYQLIVSNPPYVDAEDFHDMPEEYRHEPKLGLVSGDDGLDACREILSNAADYLSNDGVLIVEVGNSAGALAEQYPRVPFTWIEFDQGGHGVFLLTKEQLVEHFS